MSAYLVDAENGKKTDDLELEKALQRMKTHTPKARASFLHALSLKVPDVRGRLAGPTVKR
ncbi:hypothetical protein OR573_01485 [Halomonas sp. CH40]